ncbi:MAG: hypothetical protein QM736_23250 [Vicinamibacterales bacterium]
MKNEAVVLPFRTGRRDVEGASVGTHGRAVGSDARRARHAGRAVRYFMDIHGSERIGHADGIRVDTQFSTRAATERPERRFVMCAHDEGARSR